MENCLKINNNNKYQQEDFFEPFYHNEIVDIYDFRDKISSEGVITSIRGDIYRVKYVDRDEEETIINEDIKIIKQCILNILNSKIVWNIKLIN